MIIKVQMAKEKASQLLRSSLTINLASFMTKYTYLDQEDSASWLLVKSEKQGEMLQ